MKDLSTYKLFNEKQSDLELGIFHYSLARKLLQDYVNELEKGEVVDEKKYQNELSALIKLSRSYFKKTEIPDLNDLQLRLEEVIKYLGLLS